MRSIVSAGSNSIRVHVNFTLQEQRETSNTSDILILKKQQQEGTEQVTFARFLSDSVVLA